MAPERYFRLKVGFSKLRPARRGFDALKGRSGNEWRYPKKKTGCDTPVRAHQEVNNNLHTVKSDYFR